MPLSSILSAEGTINLNPAFPTMMVPARFIRNMVVVENISNVHRGPLSNILVFVNSVAFYNGEWILFGGFAYETVLLSAWLQHIP